MERDGGDRQAVQPARIAADESTTCWTNRGREHRDQWQLKDAVRDDPDLSLRRPITMNLPTEIFGDVIVVHTPEELGADQVRRLRGLRLRAGAATTWCFDLDATETIDSKGLTALLNVQDKLRDRAGEAEDRHHQPHQPQDPRNHPPRPAIGSVRQRRRRREELSLTSTRDDRITMDTATLAPRRLGSLLVDKGYLTPDDLQSALEQQKQEGRKKLLGEILVERSTAPRTRWSSAWPPSTACPTPSSTPGCSTRRSSTSCRGSTSRRTSCCRCSWSAAC